MGSSPFIRTKKPSTSVGGFFFLSFSHSYNNCFSPLPGWLHGKEYGIIKYKITFINMS